MKKYKIYFEMFGKKMVTDIVASDEQHAKRLLADKIIFHKVKLINMNKEEEDIFDMLKNIFNL